MMEHGQTWFIMINFDNSLTIGICLSARLGDDKIMFKHGHQWLTMKNHGFVTIGKLPMER